MMSNIFYHLSIVYKIKHALRSLRLAVLGKIWWRACYVVITRYNKFADKIILFLY